MKNLLLFCVILLIGCSQTPPEIQAQINKLNLEKQAVNREISSLKNQRSDLSVGLDSLKLLREEVRALEVAKNGGDVEYLLICELSQDRSGMLDMKSYKDYLNAVELQIPVDRKTYNHYRKGDEFFRKGRKGSAMTEGSYSDWLIKVIDKRINYL